MFTLLRSTCLFFFLAKAHSISHAISGIMNTALCYDQEIRFYSSRALGQHPHNPKVDPQHPTVLPKNHVQRFLTKNYYYFRSKPSVVLPFPCHCNERDVLTVHFNGFQRGGFKLASFARDCIKTSFHVQ